MTEKEPLVVQQMQSPPRQRSLVSMVNTLISRMAFAAGAGLSFNGSRDLYATFGYKLNPTHTDFVTKFLKQDVATRVIKAPVDALWSDKPEIIGGPRFEKAWKLLATEQDIFAYIAKADIFAGLGNYACLLIGLDDGQPLSSPVNSGRANKIIFLQPYLQMSVDIVKLVEDPTNPRYGLPLIYKISPSESLTKNSSALLNKVPGAFEVHHSRMIHLADNTLENPIVGHSRMESIYNTLDDIQKVVGGAAETFWLTGNRGMQVDVDKDMELEEGDAADLTTEIEEYQHGLRRFMRTRGVKVTNLGSDVADPKGVFFALMSLLSSNTGIPQRVLMGAEAGQLASQQDRANWAVQISQRAANWGEPIVLKPLLRQLVDIGVLPAPTKTIEIKWPEFFKMNPLERGQTSAQQARSITNVTRALDTAQKGGYEIASIEEAREMVAPGSQLLELTGPAKGTFPPKLSAPVADPQNAIDLAEKQGEIAAEAADKAAETAIEVAKNTPAPAAGAPFGGK